MGSFNNDIKFTKVERIDTGLNLTVNYGLHLKGSVQDVVVSGSQFSIPNLSFATSVEDNYFFIQGTGPTSGYPRISDLNDLSWKEVMRQNTFHVRASKSGAVIGLWDVFMINGGSTKGDLDSYTLGDLKKGNSKVRNITGKDFSEFKGSVQNTSDYFNTSNKTSPYVDLDIVLSNGLESSFISWRATYRRNVSSSSASKSGIFESEPLVGVIGTFRITLNAPPTFDVGDMYFDTSYPDGNIYAGYTTASVDISNLSAKYGGDIVSATLIIGQQAVSRITDGTLSIPLASEGTFTPTVTVTDSRGQTTQVQLPSITVLSYTTPKVVIDVERTTATGVPADEGTTVVITADFSWLSFLENLVEPTVQVKDYNGVVRTVTPTWYSARSSSGAVSGSVDWSSLTSPCTVYGKITNAFSVEHGYQIKVTPEDTRSEGTPMIASLGSAYYTIDFLAGGHGIAFGAAALEEGFHCAMPFYLNDNSDIKRSILDFIHPIGSTFETVDKDFNPNTVWGGTWTLLPEGTIILAGSESGTYKVGTDTRTGSGYKEYGSNTHTLTVDEIPSHNHSITNFLVNANGAGSSAKAQGGNTLGFAFQRETTTSAGGGQAHSIMQKSIAMYIWIRTA